MAANIYAGPERRRRPHKPLPAAVIDPTKRTVLPADYYIDKWLVPPGLPSNPVVEEPVIPRQPLEPTRIDIFLPEPEARELDFLIPDEAPLWMDWAAARSHREAADMGDGFTETIEMTGNAASITQVSLTTGRVVEKQNRLFRFAQDHDIDAPDPALFKEPPPVRVPVDNRMAEQIRANGKADRKADIYHRARKARARQAPRSEVPWGYVAGLTSALVFFVVVKLFHLHI